MRWERWRLSADPTVQNSGPGKRWGHTCNAVRGGKLLYVFGGYGKDNCQTNQVHVFDTGRFLRLLCVLLIFLVSQSVMSGFSLS